MTVTVTPGTVQPNHPFRIEGQFKDIDGQNAFVPLGYYYIYKKEGTEKILKKSGSLGFLVDGRFSTILLANQDELPKGDYSILVNDGKSDDIIHQVGGVLNTISQFIPHQTTPGGTNTQTPHPVVDTGLTPGTAGFAPLPSPADLKQMSEQPRPSVIPTPILPDAPTDSEELSDEELFGLV